MRIRPVLMKGTICQSVSAFKPIMAPYSMINGFRPSCLLAMRIRRYSCTPV